MNNISEQSCARNTFADSDHNLQQTFPARPLLLSPPLHPIHRARWPPPPQRTVFATSTTHTVTSRTTSRKAGEARQAQEVHQQLPGEAPPHARERRALRRDNLDGELTWNGYRRELL
ncbi:hypothetical protein THAOC_29930 [Thalassiosira oceanica]|uniref:Uncharacterized protein n=1 Tax=Thalassiosira oceanica TaxID=159749 RepID=K0RB65_THAOC|nr:hypothetical protein THAOC_29930 [Thalassiosira oceanica]|eukprot:EJK50958.1 hypothetical protein THAOC_29930 [Thalassiosira oceanica]